MPSGLVGLMHCPQFGSATQQSLTKSVWHWSEGTWVFILWKPHSAESVLNTSGFEPPEWRDVTRGLQPGQISLDDPMPGVARQGWQRGAPQHVEERFRTDIVWPRLDPPGQALLRSQSGPMPGVPFCCLPISMATLFEPQEFRILLLRRLWCPLPLCSASCWCGRPLDPRGHHRAACQVAGVLGRRGFPIESAVAKVC